MSDKELRNKIIRLAHAKPELRPHLLPLVQKVAISESQVYDVVESFRGKPPAEAAKVVQQGLKRGKDEDRFSMLLAWNSVMNSRHKKYKEVFRRLAPYVEAAAEDLAESIEDWAESVRDAGQWLEPFLKGKPANRSVGSFSPNPPGWYITGVDVDGYGGLVEYTVDMVNPYTGERKSHTDNVSSELPMEPQSVYADSYGSAGSRQQSVVITADVDVPDSGFMTAQVQLEFDPKTGEPIHRVNENASWQF